jgi:hypothetical protein
MPSARGWIPIWKHCPESPLTTRLDQVGLRTGCVSPTAGQPPRHDAGRALHQVPARRLLSSVMASAERAAITFAGRAAPIERDRVVDVASHGRSSAAGRGAGPLPDFDQVAQRGRPDIAGRLPGVTAATGLQELKLGSQPGCPGDHRLPGQRAAESAPSGEAPRPCPAKG